MSEASQHRPALSLSTLTAALGKAVQGLGRKYTFFKQSAWPTLGKTTSSAEVSAETTGQAMFLESTTKRDHCNHSVISNTLHVVVHLDTLRIAMHLRAHSAIQLVRRCIPSPYGSSDSASTTECRQRTVLWRPFTKRTKEAI